MMVDCLASSLVDLLVPKTDDYEVAKKVVDLAEKRVVLRDEWKVVRMGLCLVGSMVDKTVVVMVEKKVVERAGEKADKRDVKKAAQLVDRHISAKRQHRK